MSANREIMHQLVSWLLGLAVLAAAWIPGALAGAICGVAGGMLWLLLSEERGDLRAGVRRVLLSLIFGAVMWLSIGIRAGLEAKIIATTMVAGLGADLILRGIRERLRELAEDPGALVRWLGKRRGVDRQ